MNEAAARFPVYLFILALIITVFKGWPPYPSDSPKMHKPSLYENWRENRTP